MYTHICYVYRYVYVCIWGVRGLSELIMGLAVVCHGRFAVSVSLRPYKFAASSLVGLDRVFS